MEAMFTEEEMNAWKNAGVKELPAGRYVGILKKSNFWISRKDGSKKLCVTYEIASPQEFYGVNYTHFMSLDPKHVFYTHKDLLKIGLNPDTTLSSLDAEVDALSGISVELELVQKGDYLNCFILNAVSAQSKPDDIPF